MPGVAGGSASVEDIAGNDESFYIVSFNLLEEPIEEEAVLFFTAAIHEVLAKVPVRGM